GFVNTWECDEMGHMNVQFYMAKLDEGLHHLRAALDMPPATAASGLALRAANVHVRFLAEQRASDTLVIRGGVAEADEDGLTVYSEMINPAAERVAATFRTRLEAWDRKANAPAPVPPDVLTRAREFRCDIPGHGQARGVPAEPALPGFTLDEAFRLGLIEIYRGTVMPGHCDVYGWNALQHYAGRVSDGAPHLWLALGLDRQKMLEFGHGVAVVEFSWRHGAPLESGRTVVAASGVLGTGRKTVTLRHCLFDGKSGAAIGVSEAVAVALDLEARRAVELREEERAMLEGGMVQWPGAETSSS
ncbi:MAG: acyl-CoA thioesterase, partial [Alphaproteobacteria bacterium]